MNALENIDLLDGEGDENVVRVEVTLAVVKVAVDLTQDEAEEVYRQLGERLGVRKRVNPTHAQVNANSNQLVKAAELIRGAEPTQLQGQQPMERPAYLSEVEDDPGVVLLSIGILPSHEHRINRRGKVESTDV